MSHSMQSTKTSKIQGTVYTLYKCVRSACCVPDTVEGTRKKLKKHKYILSGADYSDEG